jgi:arylsulfatase A-like enzyme
VSLPEPGISPHNRQFICAMVLSIDISILQILLALSDNNMLRDTLIVYHSDNGGWIQGGSVNRPFKGDKGTVYEGLVPFFSPHLILFSFFMSTGGIHVPAFLFGNGVTHSLSSLRDDLVHVSDLLPTLLTYANIPFFPTQFDGISHWQDIQDSKPFTRQNVPINSASDVVSHFSAYIEIIVGITYKYLYNPSVVSFLMSASVTDLYEPEGEFIYNLSNDLSEQYNLLEVDDDDENATNTSSFIWSLLIHFRHQILLLQKMSVPSQLEIIPPKLEVFPSKNRCWLAKDSWQYRDFICPNQTSSTNARKE